MAQRIKLTVMGASQCPYDADLKPLHNGLTVSEPQSFEVANLLGGYDTTTAQRAKFKDTKSVIFVREMQNNHFKAQMYYVSVDQDGVNTAANA